MFCRVFDEQVRLYGRTKKAIEETIRICRNQNVLKEYLDRKEVTEVMSEVFEKEESMKLWEKDLKAEGKKDLIYELVRDGVLSAEDGAKRLGMTTLQLSENMAL